MLPLEPCPSAAAEEDPPLKEIIIPVVVLHPDCEYHVAYELDSESNHVSSSASRADLASLCVYKGPAPAGKAPPPAACCCSSSSSTNSSGPGSEAGGDAPDRLPRTDSAVGGLARSSGGSAAGTPARAAGRPGPQMIIVEIREDGELAYVMSQQGPAPAAEQ